MVWGVCRRILHDPNDVADAFQATFLVLVHRAATVRGDDALGRWLYGVSRKVAARTKKMSARHSAREPQGIEREAVPNSDPDRAEWLMELDEEISRLPQRYREVIVLCDLGGLRHDEAARQLGCAVGTVGSRVSRPRALARRADPAGLCTTGRVAHERTFRRRGHGVAALGPRGCYGSNRHTDLGGPSRRGFRLVRSVGQRGFKSHVHD